jgi:periplasmic divalent cation tolerance protein
MLSLIVLTNVPDAACADQIARALVDARAAACVNVLTPVRSIYRWNDTVETASEIPLVIKTTEAAYPDVERVIRSLHPYQIPEIIALPITQGLPDYLAWLAAETQP